VEEVPPSEDSREYLVAAWCMHPDFVPQEVIVAVPEPEVQFVVEPPLYLREHEIIHFELRALRYLVRIRVVEVQDWHSTVVGASPDDSDDSNDPRRRRRCRRGTRATPGPWTRPHIQGTRAIQNWETAIPNSFSQAIA
jgi:hypothetical protein